VLAGRFTYGNGLRESRVGPGHRQQVTATLLKQPSLAIGATGAATATARWTTPAGRVRTGQIPAPVKAGEGTRVRVWVDREGTPTTPPPSRTDVLMRSIGTAVFVQVTVALLIVSAFTVFRCLLDRRRYAQWEAAWARADDRWRRPRRP
jgi:hypothetical protein